MVDWKPSQKAVHSSRSPLNGLTGRFGSENVFGFGCDVVAVVA